MRLYCLFHLWSLSEEPSCQTDFSVCSVQDSRSKGSPSKAQENPQGQLETMSQPKRWEGDKKEEKEMKKKKKPGLVGKVEESSPPKQCQTYEKAEQISWYANTLSPKQRLLYISCHFSPGRLSILYPLPHWRVTASLCSPAPFHASVRLVKV